MKIIYLDQNQWIRLARVWCGKEKNKKIYDLILKLKDKIKNNEIRIVISQININEVRKRRDEKSKLNLIDFMLDMSQGYTISPYADHIRKLEVEAFFGKRVGMKVGDIKKVIFMKGLAGLLGMHASIKGDFTEETKKEMLLKLESIEVMRKILTAERRERAEWRDNFQSSLTDRLEKIRAIERSNGKNDMTELKILLKFISDFIVSELADFTLKYKIEPNKI